MVFFIVNMVVFGGEVELVLLLQFGVWWQWLFVGCLVVDEIVVDGDQVFDVFGLQGGNDVGIVCILVVIGKDGFVDF